MPAQTQKRITNVQHQINRVRDTISLGDLANVVNTTRAELHNVLGELRVDAVDVHAALNNFSTHLDSTETQLEQRTVKLPAIDQRIANDRQVIEQNFDHLRTHFANFRNTNLVATLNVGPEVRALERAIPTQAQIQNADAGVLRTYIQSMMPLINGLPARGTNNQQRNELNNIVRIATSYITILNQRIQSLETALQDQQQALGVNNRSDLNVKKASIVDMNKGFRELQNIIGAIDITSLMPAMTVEKNNPQAVLNIHDQFIGQGRTINNATLAYAVYNQDGSVVATQRNQLGTLTARDANGQNIHITGIRLNQRTGVLDISGAQFPANTTYPLTLSFDVGINTTYAQHSFKTHPITLNARKTVNLTVQQSVLAQNAQNHPSQQAVVTKYSPRIDQSLERVHTQHLMNALRDEVSAIVDQLNGGQVNFTQQQKDQLVAELVAQNHALFPSNGQAGFKNDYNNWSGNGFFDKNFRGTQQEYDAKFLQFLTAGSQDSIFTRGQTRLKEWIRNTINNNPAANAAINDRIDAVIRETADPVTNLLTSTAGAHTANLLSLYESSRGSFFPAQDEARRRYRGMPVVRNLKRAWDYRFRGGHDITKEVVRNVQNNSYMTFFERIDNTATPEKINKVALPMSMGDVDISVGLKYHPFQNSLSQNGTVIVNVAGQNLNVGPVERISHGYGLHGMIESVMRHRFHVDERVNNVIVANVVIAMYKTLIKEGIAKTGELRRGDERISLNNNGNIVFESPVGGFNEQTLRASNNYTDAFQNLSHLARGFNHIMQHKNQDYIDGIRHRNRSNPWHARLGRTLNPVYRYRNKQLFKEDIQFQVDGIQGKYDKWGRMTLEVQSPEGEAIQLPPRGKVKKFTDAVKRTDLEDIFSSPLVYGRQHEILRAYYKAYLERLFKSKRVARYGYWFQHDGHKYAIVNRGTPTNQQLSFCEVDAGVPLPGSGTSGLLNQSVVNALKPINENIMLSNSALMNQFIDTVTTRA